MIDGVRFADHVGAPGESLGKEDEMI
jgi:hypothetical protein